MQHISITLKINERSCSAFFLFHIREVSDEPGIDRDRAQKCCSIFSLEKPSARGKAKSVSIFITGFPS